MLYLDGRLPETTRLSLETSNGNKDKDSKLHEIR